MTPAGKRVDSRRRFQRPKHAVLLCLTLSLALLAMPVARVLNGARGLFEKSSASTTNVEAGVVRLTWLNMGTDTFTTPMGHLQPGQDLERSADIKNTGTLSLGALQFVIVGTGADTISEAFQLSIDRCVTAWIPSGAGFGCATTETAVTDGRPATGTIALVGSPAFAAAGIDHLRITLRLIASSPESDEHRSDSLSLTVIGTQRDGEQR